ncbi:hypothetical protein HCH15_10520 [Corynebacterium testudinoris]|uniref:Uncharacterized protein n=1 Tax=Corynebacterium testudinoris TaxID=136857 RepID=A0A0G3H436_9CORY|nr:hypothetical protein [Corynebacterium testudinoris]AKK08134.1 hypothetical protein CTEST_03405 [Corynebacterium testudinoris]MBX8996612.1 hypothetical protein [Corynebacterium testudinoris]
MNFYLATAIVVAILVAFSALRAPVDGQARRFPWFWVAFPITVFSAASLLSMVVNFASVPGLGWAMYQAQSEESGVQFLSNEQFQQMHLHPPHSGAEWLTTSVALLVGAVCSVWAWRRGRI